MDTPQLIQLLETNHQQFTNEIGGFSERQFSFHLPEKWSAGQQLLHIYKSLKPLSKALNLPSAVLAMTFGKAKRESRSYDAIVKCYREKLNEGHGAPKEFTPGVVKFSDREALISKINNQVSAITKSISSRHEKNMDTLQLPHPLLGKLSLREMIYFTCYHVQHHHNLMIKYLANDNESSSF